MPTSYFSALDTPEQEAFKLWTSLFAQYRVPIEASFYNRMRTGEMPIGVADYYTYVLLNTTAPELTGWWEMRPIPASGNRTAINVPRAARRRSGHIQEARGPAEVRRGLGVYQVVDQHRDPRAVRA